MAARLEIYAVDHGTHLEGWDPVVLAAEGADRSQLPDLEGFVSASDDDEGALFEVLSEVADHTAVDARTHGGGTVAATALGELGARLRSLAAGASGLAGAWLSSLAAAVGKVEHRGATLGWLMRYDLGGSSDAGPEEFPTTWS